MRQTAFRIALLLSLVAGSCRRPDASSPSEPSTIARATWFVDVTESRGLSFFHETGKSNTFDMPEIMGAGLALFDAGGDGAMDIYLLNGTFLATPAKEVTAFRNHLFRSQPDGELRDVTETSGLGDDGYGMGCAVGDIDNDGNEDVYVTNFGLDALYRNRGGGTFERVLAGPNGAANGWSTSACMADFNLDGFLDIVVVRYVDYNSSRQCKDADGEPDYCGPQEFEGVTDVLFINDGNGEFRDATVSAGIGAFARKGLGLACLDFNDDGWIDVYVANDGEPNQLWINRRDGTFVDEAQTRGVALNADGRTEAGMGVAHGDIDGDGDVDLLVTHLWKESNTLYVNEGAGHFTDRTLESGLAAQSTPHTGFGALFFDIEHDGDLDLAVANGRVFSENPHSGADHPYWKFYAEPNQLFINDGKGRFDDAGARGGAFTSMLHVTRGLAAADLDGDGDLDLIETNCGQSARLYRNDALKRGRWLSVRVIDPDLHRDAFGAVVIVETGGRVLRRDVTRTVGYLTSGDSAVHFGLGDADRIDALSVRWPGGEKEQFKPPMPNTRITLAKGQGMTP